MPEMFAIKPTQFEAFLDAVTDELLKIGVDADYTASATDLSATWTIEEPF